MDSLNFLKAITELIESYNKTNIEAAGRVIFLTELGRLIRNEKTDEALIMTQASVLFEGFYRYSNNDTLKKELGLLRAKRWAHHFGTPTITFLLTYNNQIEQTLRFFNESTTETITIQTPWLITKEHTNVIDNDNNVLSDPESILKIHTPSSREVTGLFTKTHNPFGGFTTAPCDPISQKFLMDAALLAKNEGKVLEIGAAFGAATLETLAQGATVFCNDIDPANLAVVRQRYLEMVPDTEKSITGDSNKLILVPGELPQELIGLPNKYFDAILICRVLHFFSGAKIEESLALMSQLLAPGGKIYIVCETPFLKNWQRFIPEFNSRLESDMEWPGEITDPAAFESSGRATSLPKFVHWITKEILERSLVRAGFSIEHSEYINRKGQFPEDLLLPEYGKESVGAIGII
ncbi:MAG: class I SAM-dependent methyltransferase [Legionella sp.]|uniref:class I SAM-dependent methyltransferase n=1 Tax=Legionella sp. TaxID=459 RepID=UPI002843283B|nr:class I SAM-dependent methyltransferase [Legionella sp.]